MPVEIEWDGVSLTKGSAAREQDGGWFVELEQPMPVGTTLVLAGDVQATVTVTRVHEGLGAGMVVKKQDARPAATAPAATAPTAAPVEEAEKPESGGGGEKKEKRKKRR
jgi:hypothetical protein